MATPPAHVAGQYTTSLLQDTAKEPKDLVAVESDKTNLVAMLLDFPFRRSTYYWIAFIAQFCHSVLSIIGLCVIFSLRKPDADVSGDDLFTFVSTAGWSAMSLIMLAFLLFFHYKGAGNLRSLAGYQHSCMRFCSFLNAINCFILAQPFVTGEKELLFEDGIRHILIPLMIGFLVVASGACFVATRIIYQSAVSARGTELVPYEIKVPAWKLATTEESHIYRRSGNGVKLPL